MQFFISIITATSLIPAVSYSAGGKVLSPDITLLVESQRSIRDDKVTADGVVNDLLDNHIYDYDPEYASILAEIDRRHSLYKLTHRDMQWQTVAMIMRDLSNDERVDLITHVRRYPLHKRLPATVAMTPNALNHWQLARTMFLKAVRKGKS